MILLKPQRFLFVPIITALTCCLLNFELTGGRYALAQEQSIDFVPKEAFAAILVDPQALKDVPGAEYFPHEIVTAFAKRDYGFDPESIESAKLIFGLNDSFPEQAPLVGAIFKLKKNYEIAERFADQGPATEVDGTDIFFDENLQMHFVQGDRKTILLGSTEPFVLLMSASKNVRNPFTKLLSNSKVESHAKLIVSVEKLKEFIDEIVTENPLPIPFAAVNKLHKQISSLAIDLNIAGAGFEIKLDIVNNNESDAKKVGKTIKQLLTMGKAAAIGSIAMQIGNSEDPVDQATYAYVTRIAETIEGQLTPKREGKSLKIEFKNEIATMGVMTGMLLPAFQSAREAARRTQAANDIKQAGLAFHNYHDVEGSFPAQAIYDKKGKPLLSWRVAILPYINQQALYDQFHLDEPWDSEHNMKLMNAMPMMYRNPSSAEETKTNFLAVTGKGTAFDGKKGKSYKDFKGGTSNAIMFVEADRFVPWTKPEEFEVDWDSPTQGLGQIRPGGFQAGLADGSVQFFSNALGEDTLKSLFRINSGADNRR